MTDAQLISELRTALDAIVRYANAYSDDMALIGRGAEQLGEGADSTSVAGMALRAVRLAG